MTNADLFAGPIAVTVAYLLYYYALQTYSLHIKTKLKREYKARGEKFDRYFGQDRTMLATDRYMLNTLEQMPPFLVLLWLHAVFVSIPAATIAGCVYLATRIAYPFVLGRTLGRGIRVRVLPVTFTGYGVLSFLMAGLLWAAFVG